MPSSTDYGKCRNMKNGLPPLSVKQNQLMPNGPHSEAKTSISTSNAPATTITPAVLLVATLRWPIAARLAIVFSDMGCHVEVVCPRQHPATKVCAVRRVHPYTTLNPLDSLRSAINASAPDLIIPCDDTAAIQLHRLYLSVNTENAAENAWRASIVRSLGTPEACAFATARGQLIALAVEEGIRAPKTAVVTGQDGLNSWLTECGFPAVIKIDRTWGGQGVSIVRNHEEAQCAYGVMAARPGFWNAVKRMLLERDLSFLLNALERTRRTITVQSFIPGAPANRAVACWQGKVLAGISVEAIHTQHPTGPATVVRVIENAEMSVATSRIVRRLGISGLWGIDFILEASTGAAYLIEMNPRATPICHLPLGVGRNLPAALYAQLAGQPPRVLPVTIAQDTIALFPGEWRRDPDSSYLHSNYHDIPNGEPELIQDCLDLPWSERGLMARMWVRLRSSPFEVSAGIQDAQNRSASDKGESRISAPSVVIAKKDMSTQ